MRFRPASLLLFGMACGQAADQPFEALNLEAHGSASCGCLRTWGDDWLDPTRKHRAPWLEPIRIAAR